MSEPDPVRPSEPWPAVPSWKPPREAAPGARIGRAEGATARVEGRGSNTSSETVLAFRLVDPASGELSEVELRGSSIAGTVRDGDWVEVADEPARSGRLELVRVHNLTTRSDVVATGGRRSAAGRLVAVLFVLFFLLVLVGILFVASRLLL